MIDFLTVKVWWWIAGALAVLNVVQFVIITLQIATISKNTAALTVAESEIKQARELARQWKSSAEQCSEETAKIKAESDANRAAAAQAVARAQAEAAKSKPLHTRVETLKAAPTPTGADCRQALKEIRK